MKFAEFTIPSTDGKTQLHVCRWEPEEEVKAVVLLVHGMEEHILRYDGFARFLVGEGYGVLGHDHLGHGASVTAPSELSYFASSKGWEWVLRDMYGVLRKARELWPDKPIFMLGHSMGSFFARRFITLFPNALNGVILSGTGDKPYLAVHTGKRLAQLIRLFKGGHYKSRFVETLALGSKGLDKWLCTRPEVVEAYEKDHLCGIPFTVSAFADFFRLLEDLALNKGKKNVPQDLPVLLAAGMKDPVGDCSKGVLKVYNRFKSWGLTDVDLFLYKDDMHEILNEKDRAEVYSDILSWLDGRTERALRA